MNKKVAVNARYAKGYPRGPSSGNGSCTGSNRNRETEAEKSLFFDILSEYLGY